MAPAGSGGGKGLTPAPAPATTAAAGPPRSSSTPTASSSSSTTTTLDGLVHFAGVFLLDDSKRRLLDCVAPLHEELHADHVTLAYRPTPALYRGLPLGRPAPLFVAGVASDYRTQVGMGGWGWVLQPGRAGQGVVGWWWSRATAHPPHLPPPSLPPTARRPSWCSTPLAALPHHTNTHSPLPPYPPPPTTPAGPRGAAPALAALPPRRGGGPPCDCVGG